MKDLIKYNKIFLVLALFFVIGSCTKDFEEMNTSPNSPTDVPAINIFTHVITAAVGSELGSWMQTYYVGCWCQQTAAVQYLDEDRYQTRDMTGFMEGPYTNQLLDLQLIIDKTTEDIDAGKEVATNTSLLAAAKIMRVWIFSFLTDCWGDIPYSEALQGLYKDGIITAKYDAQEDIYMVFFAELEEANTLLDLTTVLNFYYIKIEERFILTISRLHTSNCSNNISRSGFNIICNFRRIAITRADIKKIFSNFSPNVTPS